MHLSSLLLLLKTLSLAPTHSSSLEHTRSRTLTRFPNTLSHTRDCKWPQKLLRSHRFAEATKIPAETRMSLFCPNFYSFANRETFFWSRNCILWFFLLMRWINFQSNCFFTSPIFLPLSHSLSFSFPITRNVAIKRHILRLPLQGHLVVFSPEKDWKCQKDCQCVPFSSWVLMEKSMKCWCQTLFTTKILLKI